MKKIKFTLLIFSFILTVVFSGCDILLDYVQGYDGTDDYGDGEIDGGEAGGEEEQHVCTFSDWYITKEATCSELGERERVCSVCFESETEPVARLGHTPTLSTPIEPTCTKDGVTSCEYCSVCRLILVDEEVIPALGHTEVVDSAREPSELAPGMTEGKHCSVCFEILVRQEYVYYSSFTSPDSYAGDYAYEYLSTLKNGDLLQQMYERIGTEILTFHSSDMNAREKIVSGKTTYLAAEIFYDDLGLKSEEAIAAWCAYRFDNPLFYWMSNEISYNSASISVLAYEEYAEGSVRTEYNARVYAAVENYVDMLDGEGDAYRVALSFHDNIIRSADYAYEDDGVTPEDDAYAHGILGVMLFGDGVCESYAKTFQLLLNYCNVENVYVSGYAKGSHAWNLVQLDDCEWYWFDLTWDDRPGTGVGVVHNYFCVTDTQVVNWLDGGSASAPVTMSNDHIPDGYGALGVSFFYPLPERSDAPFDYDGIMLRDEIIEIDGLSFVVNGSRTVALVEIAAEGDVVIPETVRYKGIDFTVVSVGVFEDGLFGSGCVIKLLDPETYRTPNITSISIPKTVEFIWDYAFSKCVSIEEFRVDSENPYFASQDGVLFTKSLYTLIAYPFASEATEYITPDATVEIAFGAFGDGGNIFRPSSLRSLVIGKSVEVVGAGNFGSGYRDSTPEDESEVITVDGYFARLFDMFYFGLSIDEDSTSFKMTLSGIYSYDGNIAYLLFY